MTSTGIFIYISSYEINNKLCYNLHKSADFSRMPLPPALLKRLASRGLVNTESQNEQANNTENEEIIAEDYDEIEDPSQYDYEPIKKPQENFWIERMKKRIIEGSSSGYNGCPNKYNIFHKCTLFCINRWGDGIEEPSAEYMKRYDRLLKKYPLPKNWTEVYDHGCGVHYYWNTIDDTVSWLPPDHPNAEVSKSAATLRRELEESQPPEDDEEDKEPNINSLTEQDIQKILDSPVPPIITKEPNSPPPLDNSNAFPILKKSKSRDLEKAIRQKTRKKKSLNNEPLDPMDPASYSDIPRGKWSDGLNTESSKSGVDPTATGALFQMRPYPSPGAVLQANAANKSLKSSKDSNSDND